MGLGKLLTSFNGRISRSRWWFVVAIYLVVGVVLAAWLRSEGLNPRKDTLGYFVWNIFLLLSLIPTLAVTVKRCNDRDWPNWLGYALLIILCLLAMIDSVRPNYGTSDLMSLPPSGKFFIALDALTFCIGLVLLVDNGFLRGTPGPNRYGPDPLAPKG